MKQTRREFLCQAAAGVAVLGALPCARAAASDCRIEVLPQEPIGTISPDLYGQFTEHIGGVVYDGIWVGEDSPIPNQGGIRSALIEHLKRLGISVVRWPGGCFADSYNWRDGIGPRAERPRRTNFWVDEPFLQSAPDGPAKYDPNQFGTHEFIRFCRLIGAQPYLAANLRSSSPRDFDEWVEYCNAPAGRTTLAQLRGTNGDPEPFGVRFWGVGNESWGCGGNFTPEEYATEFRRFTAWVPRYGLPLAFIGSGPNGGDLEWTRRFFAHLTERGRGAANLLYGWALHYYCGTAGKGDAVDFTVEDWYELLGKAAQMERLIERHWDAMGVADQRRHVKLVVDEWGAWHHAGTEVDPSHLFGQTSTLRDALVAALTLDIFNRHADKVAMANVAQLINNLHSLFLAHEEKFVATPNFHVFQLYAAHRNGKSLRAIFDAPALQSKDGRPQGLQALAGSASLAKNRVTLTVVNPHASEPREAEVRVRGATIRSANGQTLTATDIHAHNTFANPAGVVPHEIPEPRLAQGTLNHVFPSASVTRLELELS